VSNLHGNITVTCVPIRKKKPVISNTVHFSFASIVLYLMHVSMDLETSTLSDTEATFFLRLETVIQHLFRGLMLPFGTIV
jgi:hypothetical protein